MAGLNPISASLLILSLCISTLTTMAQNIDLDWVSQIKVKRVGNTQGGLSMANSITTDALGNIYTIGSFIDTVDFGPDSGTTRLFTKFSRRDIFIQKLDTNGKLLWVHQFGNPTGGNSGMSITTDPSGNVYATGSFIDTVDFDPSNAITNLVSKGQSDVFLIKLKPDGKLIWAKQAGSTRTDEGASVSIDKDGNVYTTGSFTGSVDFNPDTGSHILTSDSPFRRDVYIQKLDSNGNFKWAKRMGGQFVDRGTAIANDSAGNVYTMGSFENTVDFDPGSQTFNMSSTGLSADIFIQKLDSSGKFLWAKGTDARRASGMVVDQKGSVYTTGTFFGTVDFNPNSGTFNLSSSQSSQDMFLQKLDAGGKFIWAKHISGDGSIDPYDLFLDVNGFIYSVGAFTDSADFDPGSGLVKLVSEGIYNGFIQKLDPNGEFVWSKQIESKNTCRIFTGCIDSNGNLSTSGHFKDSTDFDPNQGEFHLTTGTVVDLFVQRFEQCVIDTSISINGITLTSNSSDGSYQWLDCNNGFLSISAANGKSYKPSLNGSYAVEISKNGCTDTSRCIRIRTIGLDEKSSLNHSFNLSPNPTNHFVTIKASIPITKVEILSLAGEVVSEKKVKSLESKLDLSSLVQGFYLIKVYTAEGIMVEKVIKQ